jgi:riboflavin kinase / FMN adenylyltransferase
VRVWRDVSEVPADLGRTVVTIGNFDGVHLGHQHVVARAREVAAAQGVDRVVAVTFDPHPMAVLRPDHAPVMLTGLDQRLALLGAAGADDVLVLPFSREMASWSPEEFVQRVIVDGLHARGVVVGANFRYGTRAAGDVHDLAVSGGQHDFVVDAVALDGGPQVWSSTYVRSCLAAGDVSGAAEALGRPFTVRGIVTKGDQRGRELGFPTANIVPDDRIAVPGHGVYAAFAHGHPAAVNVGVRPTFDSGRGLLVEAYLLDFDEDLYGQTLRIAFVERLRGEKRFDSVDDLVAQMSRDVEEARSICSATVSRR